MYETSPLRTPLRGRLVVSVVMGGSLRVGVGTARTRRSRRSAAKAASGARGMIGERSASNGSGCGSGIVSPLVDMAELSTGAHEQGLGRGHTATPGGGGPGGAEGGRSGEHTS